MSDLFTDDTIVADRSTLEKWQECPRQARYLSDGGFNGKSFAAESGNAAHDVLSTATATYVDSQGAYNAVELREEVETLLLSTRPDLQPDVIRALRPSLWAWCKYLNDLHFSNILRFDGGRGDKSGQLAHDFDDLGLRPTSEIDLLHATQSTEVIEEIDYKSGHTPWSMDSVADAFQFDMHGMLLLMHYPDVKCVRISVWCTRLNRRTYRVDFTRDRYNEYLYRVRKACELMARWQDKPVEQVPAHPMYERCLLCPANLKCASAGGDVQELVADPGAAVDKLHTLEAAADTLRESLGKIVDATGRDIISPSGNAFGAEKPKQNRKPVKGIYKSNRESE
jgi:hypothetical protein